MAPGTRAAVVAVDPVRGGAGMARLGTWAWRCCLAAATALMVAYAALGHEALLLGGLAVFALSVAFSDAARNASTVMYLLPSLSLTRDGSAPVSYGIVLLLFCFAKHLIARGRRPRISTFALLGLVSVITCELAHTLSYTNAELLRFVRWAGLFTYAALLMIDRDLELDYRKMVHAAFLGIVLSALCGWLSGDQAVSLRSASRALRFEGAAGDPNGFAMMATVVAFCLATLYLKGPRRGAEYVAGFGVLAGLCAVTLSRSGIITFGVALALLATSVAVKGRRRGLLFIGGLAVTAGVALLGWGACIRSAANMAIARFSEHAGAPGMMGERPELARAYWDGVTQSTARFLWGDGLIGHMRAYGASSGTHNTYLELLVSWGAFGTVLFAVFVYALFRSEAARDRHARPSVEACLPLLVLALSLISLQSIAKFNTFFYLALAVKSVYYGGSAQARRRLPSAATLQAAAAGPHGRSLWRTGYEMSGSAR